jgi:hypothetical protein
VLGLRQQDIALFWVLHFSREARKMAYQNRKYRSAEGKNGYARRALGHKTPTA